MLFISRVSLLLQALLLAAAASPSVKIGKTTLTGRDVTLLKQDFFGGIPFAKPPLGKLRLRPPVLTTTIDAETFDASNFGPGCLQTSLPITQVSEDCLTINVFRPSGILPNASLPVLFWTYGGGYTSGASLIYNGSAVVAQSVARGTPLIYVNYNYRLGPLGFPQGQEAADRKALNLALKDELAALEWVQHNIGAFGGDKNKVTVSGQSAGAIMTSVLLLDKKFSRFARGAIFESGSAATSLTYKAQRREVNWQNFVAAVPQCASLSSTGNTFGCLQSANSSVFLQAISAASALANEELPWDPTIDGPGGVYPDLPSRLYKKGQFARLPSISGTVLDEGTIFAAPTLNYTTDVVRDILLANFSPPIVSPSLLEKSIDRLFELYPNDPALGSPYGTGNDTFGLSPQYKRLSSIYGDISFHSQRRLWQQTAAKAGIKSYGYLFTQPQVNSSYKGVHHGSEVTYVYGTVSDPSASDSSLSSTMTDYWVSFATSLDPNDGHGISRPTWAQYTPKNQVVLQLNGDNTTLIPDDYRKKQTDFINSTPLIFHH